CSSAPRRRSATPEAVRDEAAVTRRPRVVLLAGPATYRADAFLAAARRLDLDVVQALDLPQPLQESLCLTAPLVLDFASEESAVARLAAFAATRPVDAILALDDSA